MSYPYLITPRGSQKRAMKDIYRTKSRLIWGICGTGKTKIAVDFIGNMVHHEKIKRALIFCPNTALGVWLDEIEINTPWMKVQLLSNESPEVDWQADGIILTNLEYAIPRRAKKLIRRRKTGKLAKVSCVNKIRLSLLKEWNPQVVVLDEGHKIKNYKSRAAKMLRGFSETSEYKIDLTGTPTGNKKRYDLYSQFRFLVPGLLPEHPEDFKSQFCVYGGWGGLQFLKTKNDEEFDKLVKPYITVIRKKGVEQKTFIPTRVDMPTNAKRLYFEMEKNFLVELDSGIEITSPIALAKMMKLQQMSGGFIRDNEGNDHELHRSKIDAAKEKVEEIRESGFDRLVIFARYLWEIDQLEKAFPDWTVYTISGKVRPLERKRIEQEYNRSGGIAICQISTGSVSLSFHKTDYTIFYSVNHSHIDFTQAQYRIDRGEVTKPCFYYLLQCKGTVDAGIYRSLRENRDVAESIRDIVDEMRTRHR